MNQKEKKAIAQAVLNKAVKDPDNVKMKTSFVGIDFNKKGQFHTAIINISLTYKTPEGSLELNKDIQVPISKTGDMNIIDNTPEEPKKKKTTKAVAKKDDKAEPKKDNLKVNPKKPSFFSNDPVIIED